jgi:arabinose-5-phosphate isomerase
VSTSTDAVVADAVLGSDQIPVVGPRDFLKHVLEAMNRHRLGIACVVEQGRLAGIITDGDIRRMLLRSQKPLAALLVDDALTHANRAPTTVRPEQPLGEAFATMESLEVWDLPVVSADGMLVGLLHLHPVVRLLMEDGAGAET